MSVLQKTEITEPQLLTIPEVANRLGLKPKTIRRWALFRKITYVKVGHAIRIPESEVDRIIQEGKVERLPNEPWAPSQTSPVPVQCAGSDG